jgi:hypothetical protein
MIKPYNMKKVIRISESNLVGIIKHIITEQKKGIGKPSFKYDQNGIYIEYSDSKFIKTVLGQIPKTIKIISITDSKFADFSDINVCDYPDLEFIYLARTKHNFDDQNTECFVKVGDRLWHRKEDESPENFRDERGLYLN